MDAVRNPSFSRKGAARQRRKEENSKKLVTSGRSLKVFLEKGGGKHLTAADLRRALNGMAVGIRLYTEVRWLDGQEVRIHDEAGQLMAVGSYEAATGLLHPRVVIGWGKGPDLLSELLCYTQ